jgi:hypothetical protein
MRTRKKEEANMKHSKHKSSVGKGAKFLGIRRLLAPAMPRKDRKQPFSSDSCPDAHGKMGGRIRTFMAMVSSSAGI